MKLKNKRQQVVEPTNAHRVEREINMRNVQLSGRVANFGKVFKAAEGDKGAFCVDRKSTR